MMCQIFEGLGPSLMGSLADTIGRRPLLVFCLVIFSSANIALAVQDSHAGLLMLRGFQSVGSSAAMALVSRVIGGTFTAAEKGVSVSELFMSSTMIHGL